MLALRPARPGESLLPEPEQPRVFRVAPVSDLVPLAGGRTVLVRDVPAANEWTAEIWSAVEIRVEPSKFALLPGGFVALDVFMDSSPIPAMRDGGRRN